MLKVYNFTETSLSIAFWAISVIRYYEAFSLTNYGESDKVGRSANAVHKIPPADCKHAVLNYLMNTLLYIDNINKHAFPLNYKNLIIILKCIR